MKKGSKIVEMSDLDCRAALEMEIWTQYTDAPWQIRRLVRAARTKKTISSESFKHLWPAVISFQKYIKDPEILKMAKIYQGTLGK